MLRRPEYILFKLLWPPTWQFLPPPFIAESELVQPLGSNTKLPWGKDEEEWLGPEAAGLRSNFALSWSAPLCRAKRRRSPRGASSFLRARVRRTEDSLLFSAGPKVFPQWVWPTRKREGLGNRRTRAAKRGVSGPGQCTAEPPALKRECKGGAD